MTSASVRSGMPGHFGIRITCQLRKTPISFGRSKRLASPRPGAQPIPIRSRPCKGRQAKKAVSARTPTTATKATAPARQRGRTTPAKPAGGKRASPTLGEQVLCLGKRQDAARNHGCMQGRAPEPCRRRHWPAQASWPHRTAMGSSTPRSRRRRSNAARSDIEGNKKWCRPTPKGAHHHSLEARLS
jgi:hypothetical protein